MKRLIYLFLTLFTAVTYGQADFPEGVQISGGQPTTTTDPYLTTTGTTGLQGKVTPEEIPLTIIPPTTHYTPVTPNLKGHFQGIDNAIGNIPLTTAGNTTRVWFTGDATTITAGTFYLTNPTSKGTVANVSQSVTNDDNQKKYFTQDLIGQPFATATLFPPGVYAGNLSASTTPNSAQQRFTVELYKCDTNGTPIASGIAGAPVGDLGVTVILILDSGLLTLADGSVTNVPVSASLASQLSVSVGERIRYHVSAEKVGTVASNITESIWYGNSFNSFLDVPTPITSSGVSNVSTVTGASVTNALDNLNTGKENTSNKQNSLITDGTGVKFPTVDAVSGGTSYKRTIAQIRALSGTLPNTNFYTTDLDQEGNWYYDSSDITSSDNTGTILVTSDGKRIKRIYQGIVNVKWFGAKGDASTNDTSAIQSAVDFAGLFGHTVFFPSGDYFTSGNIQINSRVNIIGDGERIKLVSNPLPSVISKGSTSIFTNSNSNDLFVVNIDGVSFGNITLYSTAATPTGSGILFNKANTSLISNVGVFGFDTNINVVNGASWSMINCFLYNPVTYNISINHQLLTDGGDQSITNCDFYAGTRAGITHILYKGGGGLKITSCKFNYIGDSSVRAKECIKLTNDVGGTSDLLISNNSFENYTDRAINLSPVFIFSNIVIDGNQFAGYEMPTTETILINSANASNIVISNNVIGYSTVGINYVNGDNVSVSNNQFHVVTNDYVNSLPFAVNFNPSKLSIAGTGTDYNLNVFSENSKTVASVSTPVGIFSSDSAGNEQGIFFRLKGGASPSNRYGEIISYENGSGGNALVLQSLGGSVLVGTTTPNGNLLNVNGNISASPATDPNQVVVKSQLDAAARPYLVYTALISQTGTSAPTETVLENTLGASGTWSYSSTGTYYLDFPANTLSSTKTAVFTTKDGSGSFGTVFHGSNTTSNFRVIFNVNNSSGPLDSQLTKSAIEIRVYP